MRTSVSKMYLEFLLIIVNWIVLSSYQNGVNGIILIEEQRLIVEYQYYLTL